MGKDKGSSKGKGIFKTGHEDKKAWVKDRVDKGAKQIEKDRDTGGHGTGGKK